MRPHDQYAKQEESYVIVPLPKIEVFGNDVATTEACCHNVIRPRYIVIPRTVSQDFSIINFMVGMRSQLHACGEVPAEVFAGDVECFKLGETTEPHVLSRSLDLNHPIPLKIDVCCRTKISIQVQNTSPCARQFIAVVFGVLVE